MSRFATVDLLVNAITQDRTWRIREISDLKSLIEKADANQKKVLLRAAVTLCYAHWEGYVKYAAKAYLTFITLRRHSYSQLKRQFLKNAFIPRLNALSNSRVSLKEKCELIDKILDGNLDRFVRYHPDLIYSDNLKTSAIEEICVICDIDAQYFLEKSDFIDIFLLKRRNSIAHGEETMIHESDLLNLTDGTIELMRVFGDSLENNAVLGNYIN